jgi:cobalt-zinc-cadmium efflux system protein
MPHQHHGHSHGHERGEERSAGFGRAGLVNLGWASLQAVAGLSLGSAALLSDSVHNLGDAAGLVLAWIAAALSRRKADEYRTWGWHRAEQLAGFANASLVLVGAVVVAGGSIWRFFHPAHLEGLQISAWAVGGIAVNVLSAWWIGGGHNLNVRGAYLHLVSDAAISGAVVVGGVAVHLSGRTWIDPLMALAISLWLLFHTWPFLLETLDALLDAVPTNQNLSKIERDLAELDGVEAVHDLHVWSLGGDRAALTVHLVHNRSQDPTTLLEMALDKLHHGHPGLHATIQVEPREVDGWHGHEVCSGRE